MKLTGIDKRPVQGPVMVTRPRAKGMGMVGLAGDRVYDVREHGGPDHAVYAFRVVEPGEIRAGDPIEVVHRPDHDVTIAMSFRALTMEPDLLPHLLVADALPEELKDLARRRTA
jgi:MOSC domain-containing protein YiiM